MPVRAETPESYVETFLAAAQDGTGFCKSCFSNGMLTADGCSWDWSIVDVAVRRLERIGGVLAMNAFLALLGVFPESLNEVGFVSPSWSCVTAGSSPSASGWHPRTNITPATARVRAWFASCFFSPCALQGSRCRASWVRRQRERRRACSDRRRAALAESRTVAVASAYFGTPVSS